MPIRVCTLFASRYGALTTSDTSVRFASRCQEYAWVRPRRSEYHAQRPPCGDIRPFLGGHRGRVDLSRTPSPRDLGGFVWRGALPKSGLKHGFQCRQAGFWAPTLASFRQRTSTSIYVVVRERVVRAPQYISRWAFRAARDQWNRRELRMEK